MVRELTPDEWPFATNEERAVGWEHLRRAAPNPLTDHERINVLTVLSITQGVSLILVIVYLLVR